MKKILFFLIVSTLCVPALVSANSEMTITQDGKATVKGAKVMQIAGPTFYTRLYWGNSFIRLLVKAGPQTKVTRSFGEPTTLSEIAVGDMLDLEGRLESAADSLSLVPSSIKDLSIEKAQNTFKGTVVGFSTTTEGFLLYVKDRGNITVAFESGTTTVIKGSRTIDLARIRVGDVITNALGEFNYQTATLTARKVVVYFDKSIIEPKIFEGKLRALPQGQAPTTMVVTISGTDYTIDIKADTKIRNTARETTLLSRFLINDTIRIYGAVREADVPIIDAYIVRNINL